ncbi:delta-type opioid receptor [Alosa alosa]|uniref:delta-type opioid receptor n=1 Tax=Alosa alosa TaxID=278164 RepID=UPI0020152E77|nr:delta-type opioid receptor [Alosa alosa]
MEFIEESISLYNESFDQTNSTDLDDGDEVLPTGVKITIAVVYMIVCVVGLIGNSLVMYVIIRYTKMNSATYIYIFNLALADFLVLATLPFQGTDVLLDFWPFGLSLCKIVVSIDYYNMFTSVFTLTVMSMDRYIAVCHPVRSLAVRTTSKAKVVNVGVWALASAIGVPVMVMGQLEVEPNGSIECMVVLPRPHRYWEPVFGMCVFLFSFIVPVAIISVCYGLMVRRLHSVRLLSGSREKDRYLRRITRMVLAVVLAFVVCWAPVQVLALVQALGSVDLGGSEARMVAMHFCIALGYANSSLNPLLYAFLDENFKRCFRASCPHRGLGGGTDASGRKSSRRSKWFGGEEHENGIAHGEMEMAEGNHRQ